METNVRNEVNTNYSYQAQDSAPILSVKDWMITMLILAIPLLNIIMLFVWAFGGGTNPSKANYAKAGLLWALIGLVIYGVVMILFVGIFSAAFTN